MNINPELIKEFMRLSDNFEQDIRKDERRRVREMLLEKIAAETDPQRRGVGKRGKDKRSFRPNSSLARVYRCLASRKHGVNIKTLSRESGLTISAVRNSINRLRTSGYSIRCDRVGYQRPKYRLAS